MKQQTFRSNGKLLLTGEYLVIDGAKALAIPTKKGQSLTIEALDGRENKLYWKSLTDEKIIWLEIEFSLPDLNIIQTNDEEKAKWLQKLLRYAKSISKDFLQSINCINVKTELDFPTNWGLGSSSTIISNIAQWADVDPFNLHFHMSKGSGYDIACAQTHSPILYSVLNELPKYSVVNFFPPFVDYLFFIYLNQKQISDIEVKEYSKLKANLDLATCTNEISKISDKIIACNDLKEFEDLINQHEYILSHILQKETIKEKLFPMYPGAIKSLGAWGGDFILATGSIDNMQYFKDKGYSTIIPYSEMAK